MAKKMLIDATHAEETRVVVVDGNKVEEFDFETINKRQLAGNIYLAKVTRVEPSLQAAFVDYGGNRHGFLAFAEIHPDYYQIPVADRQALLDEERALAQAEDSDEKEKPRGRRGSRAQSSKNDDAVKTAEIGAMDVVDLEEESEETAAAEADVAEQPAADVPAVEADAAQSDDAANDGDDSDDDDDDEEEEEPYRAMDTASESGEGIESVADEDVTEEIRAPRRPRARRYKIQEVVKVRQILLVQVVKEERGNKGAALTTYLSLAGRYCVLMPNTARGGGISRKITQANDRKKLKEIAAEIKLPEGAGLIIRTAGAKRTKPEIRRDYEYLMRLWEQIRELTLKSSAPAAIYEEGNLIKRSIRDLYSREIDEVLVEGAEGYRVAKDFMRMIMPTHAKAVQPYNDATPLFARYQVESYLAGMFNPTVQLKSGGYIVIGITEALVAIDVNSGRATKEGSIEDTATKTNLEAAEEVARQLRLRDLAGLIVIDFIDMEDRRNNAAVEKRLKDKLKTDRARIQVGRISGFGLLEMSRQRLRPGMLESTTQPCAHCHGTGLIRSDDSMALQILRSLEEEGTRKRSREVLLRAPIAVVNFLMNQKREHIATIEARYGMSVRIEGDPAMISPDYSIEKFKTATRVVQEASAAISGNSSMMGAIADDIEDPEIPSEEEEEEEENDEVEATPTHTEEEPKDGNGRKKRRRRRRRRSSGGSDDAENNDQDSNDQDEDADTADIGDTAPVAAQAEAETPEEAPKKRTRSRTRKPRVEAVAEVVEAVAVVEAAEVVETVEAEAAAAKPVEKPKARRTRKPKVVPEAAEADAVAGDAAVEKEAAPAKKAPARPRTRRAAKPKEAPAAEASVDKVEPEVVVQTPEPVAAPTPAPVVEPKPEPVAVAAEPAQAEPVAAEEATTEEAKPRRRGWWNLSR
ncbi:Rne/Rng family ribonuclease (plasmid) [Pseudorhodobacter turbinis]|uniref:Ribonuclease E n=1 Tax=Pseudorhodobacter turbinis TaxID=2500533 RepID=A0A4P8EJ73_9RHOB|nr:ribonuclease E/G [Pseudorhodobacter turbinis]QCO57066.1 Rne/Rng family ribonuclease [Pseudorhodobacter turbinis]